AREVAEGRRRIHHHQFWRVARADPPFCPRFQPGLRRRAADASLGGKVAGGPSMGFEFGVFHEFQRRPGQSEAEAFTTAFEQVDAAERWGLDAIWLAEIHMAPERSVCSVPMTIASAIAARTKNIRIGTGVQVLPLCQPLRLAEDSATVDHISHGRLIFGVGRSGLPRPYEYYGLPYGESPERFAEVLEIVRRAWTEERFSFAGKYYNYENVCIVPKPYSKPYPPIRIAANREESFVSAAKH